MKFLIDECLSPALVRLARERGHGESTHVTWLGLRSRKDWSIVRRAVDAGYVLVTNNTTNFTSLVSREGAHAGLVCLDVGIDAIRYHMETGGYTQADLGRLLGSRQRASEILTRRRPLTMKMAWRLHREWGIPAEALIAPPQTRGRKSAA